MANVHTTLTSLFDDIADAIRENTPVTEQIKADAFPAYIRMLGYDGTIPSTPSVLNSCSWDFIRWCSDEGIAELLWSVGDRKTVSLGAWGASSSSQEIPAGSYDCYILGFNHNAALEGNNLTHFEFGFSGNTHIAFCSLYNWVWNDQSITYYQRMNPTATNVGGWKSCTMRTSTLTGNTRSFKLACPSDLSSVVKTVTKYTDNVGNGTGSVESNVTATLDTFFLLNVNECRGEGVMNTYEKNKSEQYQYYKNGNSKIRNKSNSLNEACYFYFRSPYIANATQFIALAPNGVGAYSNANVVYAFSPAFCV